MTTWHHVLATVHIEKSYGEDHYWAILDVSFQILRLLALGMELGSLVQGL